MTKAGRWRVLATAVVLVVSASHVASVFAQEPRPVDGGAFRVGGSIKPPAKTKDMKPVYPAMAKQLKVQGVVIIEATIGVDGRVTNAKILRSIRLLDDAALIAVKAQEFKPTVLNGKPVPIIMTIPINFTMD